MTSSDPEVIRRQIEETRSNLSYDVDALNEKVNPTRVVDRRVGKAKSTVSGLKDRVFGSAHQTRQHASGTASNVAGSVQGAASTASAPPPRISSTHRSRSAARECSSATAPTAARSPTRPSSSTSTTSIAERS